MKAIDTNILVRFLVKDDVGQAEKVKELFEKAEKSGLSFYVCTSVILELIWVLNSVYALSESDILSTLEKLLRYPIIEFENRELVSEMIENKNKSGIELADLLIGLNAHLQGCEKTLTFDKQACKSKFFEILR